MFLGPIGLLLFILFVFWLFGFNRHTLRGNCNTTHSCGSHSLHPNHLSTRCSNCNSIVSNAYKFCPFCQTSLQKSCSKCGMILNSEWKYCPHCGN